TNVWNDYSVQARLRFPANAFGGALGGRLDAVSGAHYGAWIYPEGSTGASNVLRLIKFQNWTTWNPVQEVSLGSVGTNFHTVKFAFLGRQVAVYFDGALRITTTDSSPYLSGGVSVDMWTDASAYVMGVDDVLVSGLVANDAYSVNENSTLTVPAPGVLANDTSVFGQSLSASVLSGPPNGSISLNTNGGFTYTPHSNFSGIDQFNYQVNEGTNNLGNAWVTITVNPVAPINPVIKSVTLSNSIATLSWSSISGRTYRLQFATDVRNQNWSNVVPDLVASGTLLSVTNNTQHAAARFFRVILLP
ncbi:MAG TPA: cadherin-like domain-containing protein, partial [Candidatus Dormibacteraeota bacterium]|nr:cadherin-like domain-containing protein [Candidatus Dormibacteraeota bacterium]